MDFDGGVVFEVFREGYFLSLAITDTIGSVVLGKDTGARSYRIELLAAPGGTDGFD